MSSSAPSLPWLSRSDIEQVQLRKLNRLVQAVAGGNRFYTRKLELPRPDFVFTKLADFLANVPYTTKHEVVKDHLETPPYGTNLTFPRERYSRCHQTSGSTAVPIRWLDTPESWDSIVDNWVRILSAAGTRPSDRFFFAFSFGPFLGFWSAIEAVHRLGCFCFPGGGMTSPARAQAILDNGITVLCCTPTYAQHLGQVVRERQLDIARSRLRRIIVAGEPGGSIPATRASIERLWPGAQVFDHHGMTEVGPVTYQCPEQPGVLHVLESAYFPEIVDPSSLKSCAPGITGELVLTTLDRLGSPLLRYRTGDLVKARSVSPCRCGSHELALEGGIVGRADDMVVVRGVNVYPSLVEEVLRREPDVTEYRVTVDYRQPMVELAIDFETAPHCADAPAVQARLQEAFQTALNLRIPLQACSPGALPRFEMKARRWVKLTEGLV